MTRTFSQQKAALTRAKNTGDRDKVIAECRRAVNEWERGDVLNGHNGRLGPMSPGVWPDDWALWQRTLDGVFPVFHAPDLRELIDDDTPTITMQPPGDDATYDEVYAYALAQEEMGHFGTAAKAYERADDMRATNTMPDFTVVDSDSDVTYTPYFDGDTGVGFRCEHVDGRVEYIYLNPSGGSDDGVATVFVYQGTHGRAGVDDAVHHYIVIDEETTS